MYIYDFRGIPGHFYAMGGGGALGSFSDCPASASSNGQADITVAGGPPFS